MNIDQTTLVHIAIGAGVAVLILLRLGWKKPQGSMAVTAPPQPALPPGYQYQVAPPAPGAAVAFDIPNLPVKAVLTLQAERK
jgi:hypothetical protein